MAASYVPQFQRWLRTYYGKDSLGDQIFGRADMAYVIACRAGAPLIETLIPPWLDHSRID